MIYGWLGSQRLWPTIIAVAICKHRFSFDEEHENVDCLTFWVVQGVDSLTFGPRTQWCTHMPIWHCHFLPHSDSFTSGALLGLVGYPTSSRFLRTFEVVTSSLSLSNCDCCICRRQTGPVWAICEKSEKTSNQQNCRLWVLVSLRDRKGIKMIVSCVSHDNFLNVCLRKMCIASMMKDEKRQSYVVLYVCIFNSAY